MKMKEFDLTEFEKLKKLLTDNNIPFEDNSEYNICGDDKKTTEGYPFTRHQICYPDKENCISDVIISYMSYGRESGLLEQMGLIPFDDWEVDATDEVEGWLTAETVFERWKEDWENRMNPQ